MFLVAIMVMQFQLLLRNNLKEMELQQEDRHMEYQRSVWMVMMFLLCITRQKLLVNSVLKMENLT